jgi:hypothetical protein
VEEEIPSSSFVLIKRRATWFKPFSNLDNLELLHVATLCKGSPKQTHHQDLSDGEENHQEVLDASQLIARPASLRVIPVAPQ